MARASLSSKEVSVFTRTIQIFQITLFHQKRFFPQDGAIDAASSVTASKFISDDQTATSELAGSLTVDKDVVVNQDFTGESEHWWGQCHCFSRRLFQLARLT